MQEIRLHPGGEAIYVEVNYVKLQKQQQVRKQSSKSTQRSDPQLIQGRFSTQFFFFFAFSKQDPELIFLFVSWKHKTCFPLSPMKSLLYILKPHCSLQTIFCIIFFHNMLRTNYFLSQHTHHNSLKKEEKH